MGTLREGSAKHASVIYNSDQGTSFPRITPCSYDFAATPRELVEGFMLSTRRVSKTRSAVSVVYVSGHKIEYEL